MIADHLGGANKKADAATPEDSSAVRQKGDAMEPARPSDEDIWREAFMVLLRKTSYAWERTSEEADRVLAVYRKRWPR